MLPPSTTSLPHLHAVVDYYTAVADANKLDFWQKRLATEIDRRVARYAWLTEIAKKENNENWNQALIEKIRELKPDYSGLLKLIEQHQQAFQKL